MRPKTIPRLLKDAAVNRKIKELVKKHPEYFTLENLLLDRGGENMFHICTTYGGLKDLPKEFLTEENLLKTGKHPWDAFHTAAVFGTMKEIPKQFLTPKNLLRKMPDEKYQSILQCCLEGGNFRGEELPFKPREWIKDLSKLKKIEKELLSLNEEISNFSKFVKEVAMLKKLKNLPSLKI